MNDNTLVIVVVVILIIGFVWWAVTANKREGYADQVLHYGVGQVAGAYPSWEAYPKPGYDKPPQFELLDDADPYPYRPRGRHADTHILADHREAKKRLSVLGTGGVDIRKACNDHTSIAKHRFASSAGLKPLESME